MDKELDYNFSICGIKTEQFAVIEENFQENLDVQLQTIYELKIDPTSKQLGVFLTVSFLQNKAVFIRIIVSVHFKIAEDTWAKLINPETKSGIIHKEFFRHLAMISSGTTRGILHAKTENTVFSKFIIPTINVVEIIKEDTFFSI